MADSSADIQSDLAALEADLKKLEAEYNMFFAGRLPRPPWETRTMVADAVKRLDRLHMTNYAHRFRLTTLQTRFTTFVDLWDRGLRAREEGRPSPFAHGGQGSEEKAARSRERILRVTTIHDPAHEEEKLRELYQGVTEARRAAGQKAIPYRKFADLVSAQVESFKQKGTEEVAFCVAVKDGKVAFTARARGREQK